MSFISKFKSVLGQRYDENKHYRILLENKKDSYMFEIIASGKDLNKEIKELKHLYLIILETEIKDQI